MDEFTSAKRSRSAHLAQLTKVYNEIERLMVSEENVEIVKQLNDELCDKYEQFKTAHFRCLEVCDDTSKIALLETNFSSQQKNFTEFNERYTEWHRQFNADEDENISVRSSVTSARSSSAKLLSAKAKRLIAENRLRTLQEKQKLEKQRIDIENKRQLLEMESELEEAKIQESVWEKVLEEDENLKTDLQLHLERSATPVVCPSECRNSVTSQLRGSGEPVIGITQKDGVLPVEEFPVTRGPADDHIGKQNCGGRTIMYPEGVYGTSGKTPDVSIATEEENSTTVVNCNSNGKKKTSADVLNR